MIYLIIGAILLIIFLFQIWKSQQKNSPVGDTDSIKQSQSYTENSLDDTKWEVVNRKTLRWKELGFGDGDSFPGYGRLFDRQFKVWSCDIGSKEVKEEQFFRDRVPMHSAPKRSETITGEGVYLDKLEVSKGFESLYTGVDNKNRKRWYFGLLNVTPTWIQTEKPIENLVTTEEENIRVPDGWEMVRNHSKKWSELGFDSGFPGYGKVHLINFDIWYVIVGSKEKLDQSSINVSLVIKGENASLSYFERICDKIEGLNGKQINFDRLSKPQGYIQLYSGLDNSTKRRWYLGVKEIKPTKIFTTNAE